VQDNFGFALYLAQIGQHPPSAKPLKGIGGGIVELMDDFDGDTFRAVYTVRFRDVMYAACIQEEIQTGNCDAQRRYRLDTAKIEGRRAGLQRTVLAGRKEMKSKTTTMVVGSDNIFADLGFPDAETHLLKAQIVSEIYRLVTERKLTQVTAGRKIGISQPEVSRLFKGHFREYSVERLMDFLLRLGREVEIVVRPRKSAGKNNRIIFTAAQV
jgi:predicted XRE-type DNA-binding protein